jgi:TonB family protein
VWDGAVVLGSNTLAASVDLAGSPVADSIAFTTTGDPYADAVVSYAQGTNGGFNAGLLPGIALGSPVGSGLYGGGLDVVSLGRGGEIVLEFVDNVVVDGPGVDLVVFENAFLELAGTVTQAPFAEPGLVSVSQDGVVWTAFPCDPSETNGPYWPGCAGVYPVLSDGSGATPHASVPTTAAIEDLVGVSIFTLPLPAGSGGDRLDLADVALPWIRYVRIEAADFDPVVAGAGNSGFDLDALVAVHSGTSEPISVPAAGLAGWLLLVRATAGLGARAARSDALPEVAARPPMAIEDAVPRGPSLDERLEAIRRRIQRAVIYPPIARERGVGGEALVRFEIGADGLPRDVTAIASSGSGALDRAAVSAVERAGRLPYVFGRVTVPVRFDVRETR